MPCNVGIDNDIHDFQCGKHQSCFASRRIWPISIQSILRKANFVSTTITGPTGGQPDSMISWLKVLVKSLAADSTACIIVSGCFEAAGLTVCMGCINISGEKFIGLISCSSSWMMTGVKPAAVKLAYMCRPIHQIMTAAYKTEPQPATCCFKRHLRKRRI